MIRILKLAAIASMATAMPALAAVGFSVGIGDQVRTIQGSNSFQSQLNDAGLHQYTAANATITLTGRTPVRIEFMGSHSGPDDMFMAGVGTGKVMMVENTDFMAWGPILLGALNYKAGPINDWQFSSLGGAQNKGLGSSQFAIFLPRGLPAGGIYNASQLYLGFDNQNGSASDNHDDLIIRVTADSGLFTPFGESFEAGVPEPASWALLIAGFGLVGGMARRRRRLATAAAA